MPVEPPIVTPRSLDDAYAVLAEAPHRPIAGGTDVMVQLTGELGPVPDRMVDLWRLDELRGIGLDGDRLVLGALTTFSEIRHSPLCRDVLPALVEAAATIGAAQIQNRATIGGNVDECLAGRRFRCRSCSRPTPSSSPARGVVSGRSPRARSGWPTARRRSNRTSCCSGSASR